MRIGRIVLVFSKSFLGKLRMNPEYMRKVIAMTLLFSPGAVWSKKPLGQRVIVGQKIIVR